MKVLLLVPDKVTYVSSALYASLRTRVGTCDVYHLNKEHWDDIEIFFQRFVRKEQYDRIVIAASPVYLLKKIKFFRSLPALVILRLQHDSESKNVQMAKVLSKMPWARWIGVDDEICHEFAHHGWDASWIPPVYDADWFHGNRPLREKPVLHIFDPGKQLVLPLQHNDFEAVMYVPAEDSGQYLNEHVKPQDILIFQPKREHYEPTLVIQAMACGAVVFLPPLNLRRRVLYGWHDGQDCIFFGTTGVLPELLDKILQEEEMRQKISQNAIEKAMLFHPKEVGQRLGACLEPALRNPGDYPQPRRIFGIEIGW